MIVALILAAGQGTRFGSDKRQAPLNDGRTLLQHSVERALEAFDEVRVVLRAGECVEGLGLPATCRVVHSPDAALGMGHSLAAGIVSLSDCPAQAVAILLGDMPWILPHTLRELARWADPGKIVVPRHNQRNGHPVLFGRDFWPVLSGLTGDEGARLVLQRHPQQVVWLQTDDVGVLQDVDTPLALP